MSTSMMKPVELNKALWTSLHLTKNRKGATEITKKLEKDGLKISDCGSRCYDNGANMSGKYNGYVWKIKWRSSSHTFSL